MKRSRYNVKQVLTHWEEVILFLCENINVCDVLDVTREYLEFADNEENQSSVPEGYRTGRFLRAKQFVELAIKEINPEQDW